VLGERLLAAVELVLLHVELELDVSLPLGQCAFTLLDLLLVLPELVLPLSERLFLCCEPSSAPIDVGGIDLDSVRVLELGLARVQLALALLERPGTLGECGLRRLQLPRPAIDVERGTLAPRLGHGRR
jgi:hypothetical protein